MPAPHTHAQAMQALVDCLQKITAANGYGVEVRRVLRGIHLAEHVKPRPALSVAGLERDLAGRSAGWQDGPLQVVVLGYVDVRAGDVGDLEALAAAAITALTSAAHNPDLHAYVELERIGYWEGGLNDPAALFELYLTVSHPWVLTNP